MRYKVMDGLSGVNVRAVSLFSCGYNILVSMILFSIRQTGLKSYPCVLVVSVQFLFIKKEEKKNDRAVPMLKGLHWQELG